MTKPPAFQFYAADYLADENVQLMTLEEEGIYVRLMAFCWREGSIPNDVEKLCRLCKNASEGAIRVVIGCFKRESENGDRLIHPRLEEEREKQNKWREKSAEGGKKASAKRWGTNNTDENKHPNNGGDKGGVTLQSSSSISPIVPKGTNKKESRIPESYEAKRIAKIFNRRETTGWSHKEIKAFKALMPIDHEDLEAVEEFYEEEGSKPENYLRRELITFLNNFRGEVDKARKNPSQKQTIKIPNIG